DKDINKKIIEDTVKKIKNQDKNFKPYPDPVERNLNIITDLYRRNRLKKEEIEEYMDSFEGYSEYFDLVFNIRNLNFTNIELLQYLKEEEIETLMEDEKIKECIYNLLEEKLENNLLEKYKDILDSLYVKKY
ncbi:SIR2 family protein, partial [Staphylococcus hominis]